MSSLLEAAERLLKGELVKAHFETRTAKHDFDYLVFKKMLDLLDNDIQKASRTLVNLKTTPND